MWPDLRAWEIRGPSLSFSWNAEIAGSPISGVFVFVARARSFSKSPEIGTPGLSGESRFVRRNLTDRRIFGGSDLR